MTGERVVLSPIYISAAVALIDTDDGGQEGAVGCAEHSHLIPDVACLPSAPNTGHRAAALV